MQKMNTNQQQKTAGHPQVTLEVYDPTGERDVTHPGAPRLADLHGKTICLAPYHIYEGPRMADVIKESLQQLIPDVKFIADYKLPFDYMTLLCCELDLNKLQFHLGVLKEKRCDAMIMFGVGDGGLANLTGQPAAAIEKIGIPVVAVVGEGFEHSLARAFEGGGVFGELTRVVLPDKLFLPGSDLTPLKEKKIIDQFIAGLTEARSKAMYVFKWFWTNWIKN
jgi:hypothetical protein